MHLPRQYIQLHRDTTVQSLMVQPYVENGVISYQDSPLVVAVVILALIKYVNYFDNCGFTFGIIKTRGHVLVVDEADKAPVHITAILKSLACTGEMLLNNGRRIVRTESAARNDDIILHGEFRMIVLANRPGYPFLGNDFFKIIGSAFSCHAIENPDPISELKLLKSISTIVESTLRKLIAAFNELRRAFDADEISYPYSLREYVFFS